MEQSLTPGSNIASKSFIDEDAVAPKRRIRWLYYLWRDKKAFADGAKWAIDNNAAVDGKVLTNDIVKLKELHGKIFISGGQFTEQEAEVYEDLITKYEGLDLMKIF